MEHFLINSSVCLFSLWLVYKLLLENVSWHYFKRFYLLGSLVISAVIPFLVVRTVTIPLPQTTPLVFPELEVMKTTTATTGFEFEWSSVLLLVYVMGVLIMAFRFIKNLYALRIKSTDEISGYKAYTLVLRKLVAVPHSFLSRIYASVRDYKSGAIPDSVLQHEKAHLDQKHSWDILAIEVLLILMWFNPLLYLIKYSIKLNHEFLADQAVLANGVDTKTYQETLLAYSSNSQNRALANTFNFPIIKKRFTIMKTHTTTASGLLRSLAIVPVLALLVMSCGQEEIVTEPEVQNSAEKEFIVISGNTSSGTFEINNDTYSYKKDDENNFDVRDEEGNSFDLNSNGYELIQVVETYEALTSENITEYNQLAKKHKFLIIKEGHSIYLKNETANMQTIWNSMSDKQRANAEPWPYLGLDGNKAGEIAPPPAPRTALQYIEANKDNLVYYVDGKKISYEAAKSFIELTGQDDIEVSPDAEGKMAIKIKMTEAKRKFLPPPPPPAKKQKSDNNEYKLTNEQALALKKELEEAMTLKIEYIDKPGRLKSGF